MIDFNQMYINYNRKVFNICLRYVNDEHKAEDLTQETFLKAYNNLSKFRGDSAVYTWLYRIATNACLNWINKNKLNLEFTDKPKEVLYTDDTDKVNKTSEVMDYLNTLDEDIKETFELYAFESKSYKEIAAEQQIPIGTVKSRIHRIKKDLSEL